MAIGGFGVATEVAMDKINENLRYIEFLRKSFIEKLNTLDLKFKMISPKNALPYIISIGFFKVKAEILLHHLEMYNIFVSAGSACSSKNNKKSHVIKSLNINKDYSDGVTRFSFSKNNTYEDIEKTIEKINEIIPNLRIKRGVRY